MVDLTHREDIEVHRAPQDVYRLVSDIARTGEWSPICTGCRWDDEAGPRLGAWFTGRNETSERVWETRSQVVAADPGVEFAWLVGEGYVRWGFLLAPTPTGTRLTQTWEFRPAGIAMFHQRFGADAQTQIDQRAAQAHAGIPASLAAIKRITESEVSEPAAPRGDDAQIG
ncbi:MAG TPA: SRPBCC family protein [Pseudonocardiaceae bacterium]|jgi:hypothetical protein|nr:SRPBCC family protein [Pseudonocardiaceae bacterium]